jgi:hypothetical protein
MVDEESIAGLFEADAVLVIAGSVTTRGHRSIGRVLADRSSQGGRYYADPRTVLQVSDVALALSPQAINVMRRSDNGGWRFVICCLDA